MDYTNNFDYNDNIKEIEYNNYLSNKGIDEIGNEKIFNGVLGSQNSKDFNLSKKCEKIFNKIQDLYPSNTINSTEIYRTYNYSLNELKSKSHYFKKEDILKRAHFYFTLYYQVNCSEIEQIYNSNKCYNNSYYLRFSNTVFPNNKYQKNSVINITNNDNDNDNDNKSNDDNNDIDYCDNNNDLSSSFEINNNLNNKNKSFKDKKCAISNMNVFDDNIIEEKEINQNNFEEETDKSLSPVLTAKPNDKNKLKNKKSENNFNVKKKETKIYYRTKKHIYIGKKRKLEKIDEVIDEKENENQLGENIIKVSKKKIEKYKNIPNEQETESPTLIQDIKQCERNKKEKKSKRMKESKYNIQNTSSIETDEQNEKIKSKKIEENDKIVHKDNIFDKLNEDIKMNNFNIFDERNMLLNNNDMNLNNSFNNTETYNSNSVNEEETKCTDNKQPEKIIINQMKDEDFLNFEKDLKDYLRRTISDKRQETFFKNILPESLDLVKKLFMKDNNVSIDSVFPIYRNDYLELSLAILQGGKIKKKLSILKQ